MQLDSSKILLSFQPFQIKVYNRLGNYHKPEHPQYHTLVFGSCSGIYYYNLDVSQYIVAGTVWFDPCSAFPGHGVNPTGQSGYPKYHYSLLPTFPEQRKKASWVPVPGPPGTGCRLTFVNGYALYFSSRNYAILHQALGVTVKLLLADSASGLFYPLLSRSFKLCARTL